MKTVFITVISALIACNALAQQKVSFMGLPIEGSAIEFGKKLSSKGFDHQVTQRNLHIYEGYFLDKPCVVGVAATNETKEVYQVFVQFEKQPTAADEVRDYVDLKEMYAEKYGTFTSKISSFHPLSLDVIGRKYACYFEVNPEFEIEIGILNSGITIWYYNVRNMQISKQEDLNNI